MTLSLMIAAFLPGAGYGLARNADGVWWFTKPDGKRFFSMAPCCVEPGPSAGDWNPDNPAYSADRVYKGDLTQWRKETRERLARWGFNGLGGWSDPSVGWPRFEVLHLGTYCRVPWDDLFDPVAERAIKDAAAKLVPPLRDDPNVIGYFTDNEIGWWDDTIFLTYLAMPPAAPGKRELMSLFRSVYPTEAALKRDWNVAGFAELERAEARATLRSGGRGMRLVHRFVERLARRYYRLVHDAVRRHDSRTPILGDRYAQYWSPPVARAAGPYVQAVSANFGASFGDGSFAPSFFEGLHRTTKRPVVVTEYYVGATENRSGNRNVPPAFPVVQTQGERARFFATQTRGMAALPYVVGAHWFQFTDQPPKGRGDGENFNHGLVDIYGEPYAELTAASRSVRPDAVHARARPLSTARQVRLPALREDPMGTPDLTRWPREAGRLPYGAEPPFADLYAVRQGGRLHFGLYASEYADRKLYAGGTMPESERPCLTLNLPGRKPITVRFGGDRPPRASDPAVRVRSEGGMRYTVRLSLPLPLSRPIPVRAILDSHSRGERTSWSAVLLP